MRPICSTTGSYDLDLNCTNPPYAGTIANETIFDITTIPEPACVATFVAAPRALLCRRRPPPRSMIQFDLVLIL